MNELRLHMLQRITAAVMAPMVLLHLGIMIYAIHGGLSADEILARTRGSLGWGVFYGFFVLAVAAHAAIGLRVVMIEWWRLRETLANVISWAFGLALWAMGWRAVVAVVGAG